MTSENKTCSYCEFYIPDNCCELCNELMNVGECEVVDFDKDGNFISGNEYVQRKNDEKICDKFKIREDAGLTEIMKRRGAL